MALFPRFRSPQAPRRPPLRTVPGSSPNAYENMVGLGSSPVSPDELIIRQRLPEKMPQTSSDMPLALRHTSLLEGRLLSSKVQIEENKESETPNWKINTDHSKRARKRLIMAEDSKADFPECLISSPKRFCFQTLPSPQSPSASVSMKLQSLSHSQLVYALDKIIYRHPHLEKEIVDLISHPDISPSIEILEYFLRNIYKSIPITWWGTRRDSYCYRRVRPHLDFFREACLRQGKQFLDSGSWEASVNYVLQAWHLVHKVPTWDSHSHNRIKEHCYKTLTAQAKSALSKVDLGMCLTLLARFEKAMELSTEIEPCVLLLKKRLEGSPPYL